MNPSTPPRSRLPLGAWSRVGLAVGGLAVAGCAAPAPIPPAPAPIVATFRQADATGAFDDRWWRTLADGRLESLVSQATAGNPDWRIALTRVEQARAGVTAAASRLAPTVALNAAVSDQRSGLPETVKRGSPDLRAGRVWLDLGWEVDLFGAARAARNAAAQDADAAAEGARAARLLAAAETARQYVVWQGARARLAQLDALVARQAETERLTRVREADGQASRFDVSRAAAETRSLQAQLPPLRSLITVTEHQIATLVGRSPSEPVPELVDAGPPVLPAVPPLLPGQPIELLLRRPDLRAAERQWAAEQSRSQEAAADRLPRLFLAALTGRQDLRVNGLDLSPVSFQSVALAFAWPLFDAGRLAAAQERAAARERGAGLQFERAVLDALRDVESSLVSLAQERDRAATLAALHADRAAAVGHAEALRREGQIDLLPLLDAQRGLIAAELSLVEHRTQLALDGLQLYRALGGGWSLPSDPVLHAIRSSETER